jgi:hypothetical protein
MAEAGGPVERVRLRRGAARDARAGLCRCGELGGGDRPLIERHGGQRWKRWNEPIKHLLAARQRRDRADPARGWWESDGGGTAAGAVRTTALCCITSGVYYRIGDMEGWRRPEDRWNE